MIVVGIDPGFQGAFAVIEYSPKEQIIDFVEVVDAPIFWRKQKRHLNAHAMSSLFEVAFEGREGKHLTVIESVGARPGDRVSSAFRFGYGAGIWLGAVAAFREETEVLFVEPNAWKNHMGVTADKKTSLVKARVLFPSAVSRLTRNMDEGRAEALLIAYHGLLQMQMGIEGKTYAEVILHS